MSTRLRTLAATWLTGLLGLGIAAPAAQAASISQGYYLFYRHDLSAHANCSWARSNHYLAFRGIVTLHPYRTYKGFITNISDNGYFETVHWQFDGFSSAVRDLYCRYGDYAYEYFGMHKVERTAQQVFYCYGMSCLPWTITTYSPWRSRNWV